MRLIAIAGAIFEYHWISLSRDIRNTKRKCSVPGFNINKHNYFCFYLVKRIYRNSKSAWSLKYSSKKNH